MLHIVIVVVVGAFFAFHVKLLYAVGNCLRNSIILSLLGAPACLVAASLLFIDISLVCLACATAVAHPVSV